MPGEMARRHRKPRHYRLDIQIFMGGQEGKERGRGHY